MTNFDYVTKENTKYHNGNWPTNFCSSIHSNNNSNNKNNIIIIK